MNLNQINKSELLQATKNLVTVERKITLALIDHLREIERRFLFLEMGFGSLFEFCIKYLGLSEGSAHRRISAMRLSRDIPGVKEQLIAGSLSLSNAAKIQVAFNQNKKKLNHDQKTNIIQECKNTTQEQCEKKLFSLLPEYEKRQKSERQRRINHEEVELKLIMTQAFQIKLNKLKAILSHSVPDGSTLKMIEYLIDKEIKNHQKKVGLLEGNTKLPRSIEFPKDIRVSDNIECLENIKLSERIESLKSIEKSPPLPSTLIQRLNLARQNEIKKSGTPKGETTKSISSLHRKTIWQRAKGRCEYPGCQSNYQLQVDHIKPKSMGGSNELSNLRLLCRAHNIQQAFQKCGFEVMRRYVPV